MQDYKDADISDVYCHGLLLETIQIAEIFKDSKTFVDMPLKCKPADVLDSFNKLHTQTNKSPTKEQLRSFVLEHFDTEGNELEEFLPIDWIQCPSLLSKIKDNDMHRWVNDINCLWKKLGRKVKHNQIVSSGQSSLIYVPHPFIVPGDRFREIYYWDSYWIINGLLLCDMTSTVKGMIQNFIRLVDKYGMIPNGGRIYYLTRSQPPLLTPMVDSYYKKTKDLSFIKDNIALLEKEYNFWMKERTIEISRNGTMYNIARYKAGSCTPRPEGFKEDVELTEGLSKVEKEILLQNVASACESGWDFSTRWFQDYKSMQEICVQDIAPVDLNSILGWNERLLAKFFSLLGYKNKSEFYSENFQARCKAISDLMWCEEDGCWYDFYIKDGSQRQMYYISNTMPLFTECYDQKRKVDIVVKVLKYIRKVGINNYPGGIPTSLTQHPSQQWDFPNAWPPCVHMFIEGLHKTGMNDAVTLANDLASTWLNSNFKAWKTHSAMFEKYNVTESGSAGGGGEYSIQTGFGWTNGVVLMLLNLFPDVMNTTE